MVRRDLFKRIPRLIGAAAVFKSECRRISETADRDRELWSNTLIKIAYPFWRLHPKNELNLSRPFGLRNPQAGLEKMHLVRLLLE